MSFGNDLRRISQKWSGQSEQFIRGVEIKLFSAVILDTPVDTGRARGNWQASIGQPVENTLDRLDPGGSAAIGAMTGLVLTLRGGRVTFLANNLPYAERLENGWSQQAPAGMVRKNAARFQRLVSAELQKHPLL